MRAAAGSYEGNVIQGRTHRWPSRTKRSLRVSCMTFSQRYWMRKPMVEERLSLSVEGSSSEWRRLSAKSISSPPLRENSWLAIAIMGATACYGHTPYTRERERGDERREKKDKRGWVTKRVVCLEVSCRAGIQGNGCSVR